MKLLYKFAPILKWGKSYDLATFYQDALAALIVTIMLVPQSLAYALLAGLPPETGIYASIVPIILYAVFGTSNALAVGPVAVVSLMSAVAIGHASETTGVDPLVAALTLAFLSGVFLILLGMFKLGFLANFLSHPVISGFITASGILIAFTQLKNILGISAEGHTLIEIISSLNQNFHGIHFITFTLGLLVVGFLVWARKGLRPVLLSIGIGDRLADALTKAGPVFAVMATILVTFWFSLDEQGLKIVGTISGGLPPITVPAFSIELWSTLIGSALLISIIGFVESVSVAQTLAAKRKERIEPDQELIGLGAANIGAAFTGGFPVTGGFSRSIVNFDAGARTPAAGIFTALGLALAAVFLTPLLYHLPKATLSATIIVAVLSLVDFSILKKTWSYSKADFAAVLATIVCTLVFGVEIGVTSGVLISILIHLYKSSRPHIAIVGQIPGSEHYRNIHRHNVITNESILSIRVDESLFFANARFLEDAIYDQVSQHTKLKHVILICSAVNEIDMSALDSLEAINERLSNFNVQFHLSEVKGPVLDRLMRSDFLSHLTGQVFLAQHLAVQTLLKD